MEDITERVIPSLVAQKVIHKKMHVSKDSFEKNEEITGK